MKLANNCRVGQLSTGLEVTTSNEAILECKDPLCDDFISVDQCRSNRDSCRINFEYVNGIWTSNKSESATCYEIVLTLGTICKLYISRTYLRCCRASNVLRWDYVTSLLIKPFERFEGQLTGEKGGERFDTTSYNVYYEVIGNIRRER